MNSSTCLITGGFGYLGRRLARRLLDGGRRVRLLDSGARAHEVRLLARHPLCQVLSGDLRRLCSRKSLLDGVDCVAHLACSTNPRLSDEDPMLDVDSNLRALVALLSAMKGRRGCRIIFASSGGTIYGAHRYLPIDEKHPTSPMNLHGAMKKASEVYLEAFHLRHGVDYAALRVANLYGPFQHYRTRFGAVASFIAGVMAGEPLSIWGDGSIVRDYVYVDDVVDAFLLAMDNAYPERVFNVGTGRGVSLNELAALVERACGKKARLRRLPASAIDVPASVLDSGLFHRLSGWSPKVSLEEGVASILRLEYGLA